LPVQSPYTWDEDEFKDLAIFSENYGLPLGLMVALRKTENGFKSDDPEKDYSYGQIKYSYEVKTLFDPPYWQMAQACRTARRIVMEYIAFRSTQYSSVCDRCPPEKRLEKMLRMYRKDFLKFASRTWPHPDDRERWESVVRQLWNQYDEEHK
jgi:hypothetical protein